mmetsp:Transcript_28363/g.58494  ORF Transcript_28363/g.58494 Transcript_28363/m.58494 type:complete len:96 (-) Transcript_28363:494-781(-)
MDKATDPGEAPACGRAGLLPLSSFTTFSVRVVRSVTTGPLPGTFRSRLTVRSTILAVDPSGRVFLVSTIVTLVLVTGELDPETIGDDWSIPGKTK